MNAISELKFKIFNRLLDIASDCFPHLLNVLINVLFC